MGWEIRGKISSPPSISSLNTNLDRTSFQPTEERLWITKVYSLLRTHSTCSERSRSKDLVFASLEVMGKSLSSKGPTLVDHPSPHVQLPSTGC